ncbi:energy-coupling factor transporter transmembrane component T family protein [Roseibium sediminis]|uniref:energy-coupling factor transporter transmembrane component T family protein n=1 Tax=Roseibium sediminis TaxID=1775174 RepID=UPI00123C8086|nr:energy-coupling factor transporter transmembrane protein EcfT [Roseibium sediminis]
MIAAQIPGPSWLHSLPTRFKLLVLLVSGAVLFPVDDILILATCVGLVIGLYASLGSKGLVQLRLLRPFGFMMVFILGLHAISGTVETGVSVVLRLTAMVLMANLVSVTTRMDDMLDAVYPIFLPLKWIGGSPRKPALAVTLVIRFAPVLLNVYGCLQDAFRARTGRHSSWRLIAPLALQALKMSENVAEALTARGGSKGLSNND